MTWKHSLGAELPERRISLPRRACRAPARSGSLVAPADERPIDAIDIGFGAAYCWAFVSTGLAPFPKLKNRSASRSLSGRQDQTRAPCFIPG